MLYAERLLKQYNEVVDRTNGDYESIKVNSKKRTAIISALVELSASLSYAVTQGTSGCSPILGNPSPFPQFSLLGIGGSVRAITKYVRYLESAFAVRDVSSVIENGFSCRETEVPKISLYNSGKEYKISAGDESLVREEFDLGGEFRQENNIPLITYFSLRHGFKESKFALTAASQSLTDEILPQWTIMTLSHEIMHSRVREIFQTLFGTSWEDDRDSMICQKHYLDFNEWYSNKQKGKKYNVDCAIRNVILNFCCAMDVHRQKRSNIKHDGVEISCNDLIVSYGRHKLDAIELFVHFHDYYFVYACQPKMYMMSLWASWIKVAAPYNHPLEYLVRTLATVACGTGSDVQSAFDYASEQLDDALLNLERQGTNSILFTELRGLLKNKKTFARFKLSYYLIDHVRRFFASREITSRIDRIENDPFAEGTTSTDDYSTSVFVYGENDETSFISPVRYSLASFLHSMLGRTPIADNQWLTAWNTIVISSQEVSNDST